MSNMNVWRILEKSAIDLKEKGVHIPDNIMDCLKSARTLIRISSNCCDDEANQRIKTYMVNIESFLVSETTQVFGKSYADDLMKHVAEAGQKSSEQEREEASSFVAGIPRQQKWVRIKPYKEMSLQKLKELAAGLELEYKVQCGGAILVFGRQEKIREFVKQTARNARIKSERDSGS